MATPRPNLPIAVFDSGVGGLTVLHECLVWLPHEDFVYLGDTARFPYGGRSQAELRRFVLELGEHLVEREEAKLLVVACNAACAAGLPALRAALGERIPVVGVIDAAARLAAGATRNGRIGLLATPATLESGAYERAIAIAAPGAAIEAVACPKLAPLIQAGGDLDPRVVGLVDEYCVPLIDAEVDTVVLGCTHYPLVRSVVQRALGRGVTLVSSGEAIADEVERELADRGLDNATGRRGSYRFLCTGPVEDFHSLAARSLGLPVEEVAHAQVDSLPRVRAA